jgi:hypothetical protein
MIIPQLGFWYGAVGGGFGESAIEANTVQGVGSDRGAVTQNVTFSSIGPNIALWVSAFISPLKACFSLRWAPLLLLACGIAAMSGYRNAIAALGLTILLGIWYRGGLGSVLASAFMGVLGVAMLALVNSALPLPPNVQRSLAFLPGTWEDRYVQSTQDSTDWRMEIWKEVLLTDRWIQNKWFGDGLGYTAQELAMQMNVMEQKNKGRFGVSGFDAHRETILANGDYHSGPVQTIRTIGYLGLAALLLAQIRLAMHAHRQIQRCRNTEWFPLALLVGIPLVWAPIFFVFIFGTFKEGASALLMGYGMIRLLQNNLPLPAHVRARRVPYIPRTRPLLAEATLAEH